MTTNWALTGCCDAKVGVYIALFGSYLVFDIVFFNFSFMKPVGGRWVWSNGRGRGARGGRGGATGGLLSTDLAVIEV